MEGNSSNLVDIADKKARRKFILLCWKNYRRVCPNCGRYRIYRLKDKRLRCGGCGYTFHDFSQRWIDLVHIPYRRWKSLIKLFEEGLPPHKIYEEIEISYPTAVKAFQAIRMAIMANSEGSKELLLKGPPLKNISELERRWEERKDAQVTKNPVFGIIGRRETVKVEFIRGLEAEKVLNLPLEKYMSGSVIYAGKYGKYDSLIFWRERDLTKRFKFHASRDWVNKNDFLRYVDEWEEHHRISKEKFPLYLKELEFRYNHRHKEIRSLIEKYLVDFISFEISPRLGPISLNYILRFF